MVHFLIYLMNGYKEAKKMPNLSANEVKRYLSNLNEEGAKQLALQLLIYPEGREFIENAISEFDKFYKFPTGKKDIK